MLQLGSVPLFGKPKKTKKDVPAAPNSDDSDSLVEIERQRAAMVTLMEEHENVTTTTTLPAELEMRLVQGTKGILGGKESKNLERNKATGAGKKGNKHVDDDIDVSAQKVRFADLDGGLDDGEVGIWTQFAQERTKKLGALIDAADKQGSEFVNMQLKTGVHHVLLWLRNTGWGQYEEMFAINQIDYDQLFELTEDDMIEMGMRRPGNRRQMLQAIASLREAWGKQRSTGQVEAAEWELPDVWVAGKADKHESKNAKVIADTVGFAQKRAYVTWSDSANTEWKRGYAVLQESSLHIFKTSDHAIAGNPIVTRNLQGAIVEPGLVALNSVRVQIKALKASLEDVYLVAESAEEREQWMRQLIAAANLQVLDTVLPNGAKFGAKNKQSTALVMVTRVHINNTGPYERLCVAPSLCTAVGAKIAAFEPLPLPGDKQLPDDGGVISLEMEAGSKVLLSRHHREAAGTGANLFLELKYTSRDPFKSGAQVQYWAYLTLDDLTSGPLQLPLYKKPSVFSAEMLGSTLPAKAKSYIDVMVHTSDEAYVPNMHEAGAGARGQPASVRAAAKMLMKLVRERLADKEQVEHVFCFVLFCFALFYFVLFVLLGKTVAMMLIGWEIRSRSSI